MDLKVQEPEMFYHIYDMRFFWLWRKVHRLGSHRGTFSFWVYLREVSLSLGLWVRVLELEGGEGRLTDPEDNQHNGCENKLHRSYFQTSREKNIHDKFF